ARVTWTAAALVAAPAMAAELPLAVEAPWQPPPLPTHDLAGPYVGGHLRHAGGRSNWISPPALPRPVRPVPASPIFSRFGQLLRGAANRLRLHAAEPHRARRRARCLVSGLSTQRHLHRRLLDLLHAGGRPGGLQRECAAFRHLARSPRLRSRQLARLCD